MYYYLLSSLPYLLENSDPGVSVSDFSQACREQLKADHLEIIELTSIERYESIGGLHPFLAAYAGREKALRNVIAGERKRRTGYTFEPFDSDGVSWFRERLIQAASAESPLDGEEILLSVRMGIIEDLELPYFYQFENVLAYKLKLELLQRRKQMNRETGRETFEQTYQKISAPLHEEGGLSVGV